MIKARKGKLKEIKQIAVLRKQFIPFHMKITDKKLRCFMEVDREDDEKENIKSLKKLIRGKRSKIFVAAEKDRIAGYIVVYIKKYWPGFKIKNIGLIEELFVDERYRGRGISTQLMNRAYEWLKSKNVRHVELNVFPNNKKASGIYKKWGFKKFELNMRKVIK